MVRQAQLPGHLAPGVLGVLGGKAHEAGRRTASSYGDPAGSADKRIASANAPAGPYSLKGRINGRI
jgi:hypothetical protein